MAGARSCGTRACSTRATGSRPTAPAAAPRCRRTRSAARATATWSTRRSTCASRSSATASPTPTCWCGRRRRGRSISNVAAAVGPDITYVRIADARRRPRPGAGRGGRGPALYPEARGRRSAGPGADLVGLALPPPVRFLLPVDEQAARRVVAADFVSDRRRLGHRPPRPGLRRGRRRRSAGPRACRSLNPVDADGTFDAPRAPRGPGRFVKDADPEIIADLAAAGLLVAEQPYEHSYPHCWRCGTPLIYWAKTSWFVRTAERRGRPAARRTSASAGTPSTSSTAASASGWRATSTGPCRATATGARRCRSGAAAARPRHLHRLGGRAVASWPGATCPTSTCTGPTSTTSPSPARRGLRRAPSAAWRRCSTPGSTRDRCRRRSTTTRSSDDERLRRPSLPRRLHLRGHRPDPGLVLLAARREHAGVRLDALPQRRVPRATSSTSDGPEDVEVPGQRHRPVGRSSPTFGADALRWYFFSAGQPWTHPPGLRRRHPRVHPPDAAHAVERLQLLRHLRRPRRLAAAGGGDDADRSAAARARPLGAGPSSTTPSPSVTEALEGFDALAAPPAWPGSSTTSRTGTCAAAGPGSGRRATRAPTPPSTTRLVATAQLLAPFCPFLADELHRGADRRGVGPPRRLAGAVGRAPTPALADAHGRGPPARRPRAGGPHRRQGQGAPAAAPGAAAAPRRRRSTTAVRGRDRRPSSTSRSLEDVDTLSGLMSLDGGAQLPGARAPARARGSTR